jgi:hypothetical protein
MKLDACRSRFLDVFAQGQRSVGKFSGGPSSRLKPFQWPEYWPPAEPWRWKMEHQA